VLRLPQYLMFREFGWLDSYLPLIVPSAFATDTFFVFMLVQFLRGIPRDMEEAALIDGCNALQMLWYIIVPLLKPAIISVVVFQFIWTMNDFMGPADLPVSVEKYPVSLALKMSIGATEEVEWATRSRSRWWRCCRRWLVFFAGAAALHRSAAAPAASRVEGKPVPRRLLGGCRSGGHREDLPQRLQGRARVDLQVRDGEFMVFVGPSGCAKSTLLRMIAGLEGISGGNCAFGGRVVNACRPSSAASRWCSRTTRCTRT
jgi:hypothetical protein